MSLKDIFHHAQSTPTEGPHVIVRDIGKVRQHAQELIDEVFLQTHAQLLMPNISKEAVIGAYLTQRALQFAEYAQKLAANTSTKAKRRHEELSENVQSYMIVAMNIHPGIIDELLGQERKLPPFHHQTVARILGRRVAQHEQEYGISDNLFAQIAQETPTIFGPSKRRQRRSLPIAS